MRGVYPRRMWNVYDLDGPKTNNHVESWHNRLNRLAGKAHPNIYEAVSLFKAEQAAAEVMILQLSAGGILRPQV